MIGRNGERGSRISALAARHDDDDDDDIVCCSIVKDFPVNITLHTIHWYYE